MNKITKPAALGATLAEIVSERAEAPSTRVIEVRRAKAILAAIGLCTVILMGTMIATYFALRYEIQSIGAKAQSTQPDASAAKTTKRVK